MMVSPEWYYEEHLKGKTVDQLKKEISSLRKEINRLRKVVASPQEYPIEWGICPNPEVQLKMQCLYLKKATETLMDIDEYLKG